MTLRPALPGELAKFPTAEAGEAKFVLDDGQVVGHIAVSRVETPLGEQAWIHDVAHWGSDPMGLARLMLAARKQVKAWGFSEFFTNVNMQSPLGDVWLDHGLELTQLILKGKT